MLSIQIGKANLIFLGAKYLTNPSRVLSRFLKKSAYEAADRADSNLFEWDGGKVSAKSMKKATVDSEEIEVTVHDFCRGVWSKGEEVVNQGVYEIEPGVLIPWRKIPGSTRIKVIDKPGRGIFIQDDEGGWIADRLGTTLGKREWKRLLDYLERKKTATAKKKISDTDLVEMIAWFEERTKQQY